MTALVGFGDNADFPLAASYWSFAKEAGSGLRGLLIQENLMRLTTKGRYAVTAMLDIALHNEQGPVCLADIASRQNISLSYLEQLFSRLRKKQLVTSVRGPGGGYLLGEGGLDICVARVVDAVDETIDATRCNETRNCQNGETCLTHSLWSELNEKVNEFLKDITLGNLVARKSVRDVAARQETRQQAARDHGLSSAALKIDLKSI